MLCFFNNFHIELSQELVLPDDWHKFYKSSLKQVRERRFDITLSVDRLFKTSYCNLIDAIFFAKCINWDAAYDPKHSAKTHIPIYWIFAQITFNLPSGQDSNGNIVQYPYKTYNIPITCYGLMDVEVNKIKDWYKLSPHFKQCRDWRSKLQINDEVEVFLWEKFWTKGIIIDVVILNSNPNIKNNENDNNHNIIPKNKIIEYLQVQCVNDSILMYNRYDDRIRPYSKSSNIQQKQLDIQYESNKLTDVDIDRNQHKI